MCVHACVCFMFMMGLSSYTLFISLGLPALGWQRLAGGPEKLCGSLPLTRLWSFFQLPLNWPGVLLVLFNNVGSLELGEGTGWLPKCPGRVVSSDTLALFS